MASAPKIDLKKQHRHLYAAGVSAELVAVSPLPYLMLDGEGAPESSAFMAAVEALFSLAYGVKFAIRKADGADHVVMPLEGLWWADDMADFVVGRRERWRWTLMILQPPEATTDLVESARAATLKKKPSEALARVRLETLEEGTCGQILHVGPFADEPRSIAALHDAIHGAGGTFDGRCHKHHEIYLSDVRRTAPDKLKTILRQPYR